MMALFTEEEEEARRTEDVRTGKVSSSPQAACSLLAIVKLPPPGAGGRLFALTTDRPSD